MSTLCPHGFFKEVASRSCLVCRTDELLRQDVEIMRLRDAIIAARNSLPDMPRVALQTLDAAIAAGKVE